MPRNIQTAGQVAAAFDARMKRERFLASGAHPYATFADTRAYRGGMLQRNYAGQWAGRWDPSVSQIASGFDRQWEMQRTGLSKHFGGIGAQLIGSSFGSSLGLPTVGLIAGTGVGLSSSFTGDGFKPGFGGRAVIASAVAQGFMGLSPLEGTVAGMTAAGVYSAADSVFAKAAGRSAIEGGSIGYHAFKAAPFGLTAGAGLAYLGLTGGGRGLTDFALSNVAPGAMLIGAGAGIAGLGGSFGSALAGNKWARLGMLGGSIAASQLAGPAAMTAMMGGAMLYGGGVNSVAAASTAAGKTFAAVASKTPTTIPGLTAAFVGIGALGAAWGAITGMTGRGMEAQVQEDEYGTFVASSRTGMGKNFLNAGNMTLASHYANRSFSRR